MKESRKEADRWWRQAEHDLGYAQLGLSGAYYAQVCFQAHQVAEKALKALHYGVLEKRFVPGRSLVKLAAELKQEIGEEMKDHLSLLDQYYIPTRYPNGLPDAAPFVVYTARQAREAVEIAKAVLEVARRRLWPEG